ncbi:transposase, partial [Rubritalea marina]|uniref:transposase n=1 Tax=Rubritalea marina TaxID=361055 RepID=UPI001969A4B5
MSSPRTLAPWAGKELRPAIYHCVSRVVDRQFLFGDREKSKFVEIMRLYEEFCGVRVLSFCIMSNHFHILVEVPPRPPE